jgi:hypothetical protein
VSEFENRKKLLIAEGEVYRESLKLQIQNLRICGLKAKRKVTSFNAGNPVLAFGVPLLTSWLGRKKRARRWGALAFIGWQLYNRFGSTLVGRFTTSRTGKTAAEEYLEKRM